MLRREFIKGLGCAAMTWPFAAHAQQPTMPVVGMLFSTRMDLLKDETSALRKGLLETGYIEGRNLAFQYRTAEDHLDRLPALANDLVSLRVSVIFAASTAAPVLAAKAATSSIPIVFSMGADPVGIGAVASLSRPGGNITGVTVLAGELISKRLQILHEIVPAAKTVAYLVNTANPAFSEAALRTRAENTYRTLGLRLLIVNASSPAEIDHAFSFLRSEQAGALLIGPDTLFQSRREQIVALAARYGVPTAYPWREDISAGGLFSYSADFVDVFHKAGIYVGRILSGEKPADLPVQQPTKFKLSINLRTAKTLGLEMPASLVVRADEVIE